MTDQPKHIVILGAGPAGLGAASQLCRRTDLRVTVLEQNDRVGGNAGSFQVDGVWVDYGSHRLHPACDPRVLNDIRALLGADFLDRPRHGRINLQGRWIHFPLRPLDLLLRLPSGFAFNVGLDSLKKIFPIGESAPQTESFATVMQKGLGRTICQDFYFPYARKIWGLDPSQISAEQARRRVSAGSLGKMIRKVLNAVPGLKPKGSGRFFYPRQGFGQISEAYYRDAIEHGAVMMLNTRLKSISNTLDGGKQIGFERNGQPGFLQADQVWSTIPITALARSLDPAPPELVFTAAGKMEFRAMILVYLVLEQDRFSEYDAHYLPAEEIPITRLSEPKNYSGSSTPQGRTVLCAELPCNPDDRYWQMSDAELGDMTQKALAMVGIPIRAPVLGFQTRRLRFAYPIYRQGYEEHFNCLDDWVDQVDGVLSFGRQGLFAHDNTHHALYMAYSAVDCLDQDGNFDRQKWRAYREIFNTHVVED